jgi:hypothetical protein
MPSVILAGTTSGTALSLTSDTSGELQIQTNNGSTTAMTLTTGGNVGVGTTTPTTINGRVLHINDSVSARLHLTDSDLGTTSTNGFYVTQAAADTYFYNYENGFMLFGTNNAERMRITSAGDVGIGTSSTNLNGNNLALTISSAQSGTTSSALDLRGFRTTDGTTSQITFYNGSNLNALINVARRGSDNSGTFEFYTNNSGTLAERMRITAAGDVGIGTTTPQSLLELKSTTGTVTARLNSASGSGREYGLASSSAGGFGIYDFTGSGYVTFINSSGNVSLKNATTSANGIGITFPATQSASSDANTLDDYEEGTWTPVVGGTATYTAQNGTYTKIGRFVSLNAILTINLIGTGSQTRISGLPFAVAINGQGGIGYFGSIATSLVFIQPYCDTNSSSSVNFRTLTAGATSMGDANIFQNGTRIDFTVTYFTA